MTYPHARSKVTWVQVEDEVLVFDGEQIHRLPGSGAQIWLQLDGDLSVEDVVVVLRDRYPGVPELDAHVTSFVADLVDRRLVELSEVPVGNGLRVAGHVVWTSDQDVVVLVDTTNGVRQALSPTGSRIWRHVADRTPLPEMVSRLSQEFPDAPGEVAEIVHVLLDALVAMGFLECRGDGFRAGF